LRFTFRHSLLRDAARGEFSTEAAAVWHGRLAKVLEQQHPESNEAAVSRIAHHAAAAALIEGDLERPLRYALLAARNASKVFAWEDVRIHSEHALGWVPFMPSGPERDAQEIDAALLRCAGITPSEGHLEETTELLKRMEPMLARAEDPSAQALAEGFRFANARSLGDFDAALACADRLDAIDGMTPVAACWRLGLASLAGELSTAVAPLASEQTIAHDARFVEYARLCGRDPEVDRLGLTAFASFFLGDDADALDRANRAVRWAEERGDARSRIWALFMLCMLHEQRLDWQSLAELAPEVDEYGLRHQITPWLGVGTALSSWADACRTGEPSPRGVPFAAIMRDRGHSSNVSLRTMLLLLSARTFARCGKLTDAEQVTRDGLDYCSNTAERHMAPELERHLARILDAKEQRPAARDARTRALDVARRQGNVVSELRTLADRADAGESVASDRARIDLLQGSVGPLLCAADRGSLDRLRSCLAEIPR
jgi:hypothetical protein